MLDILADLAKDILTKILTWLIELQLAPVSGLMQVFASAGALRDLTTQPWAQTLIAASQGIASAVLALRVAWEALQIASLRAEGAPTDPGGLLKRAVMSAAAIAAGPWVARQMIVAGNLLADAVGQAGFSQSLQSLDLPSLFLNALNIQRMTWATLLAIPGLILMILIFFQGLIRTIEITLAAIISPFAALGYMSGGGMADVWWREVAVLSTAQAVQLLLLHMAAAFLVAPVGWENAGQISLGPFLFVATLWVTWRTPAILRNYAYSTGLTGAAGSVGHAATYVALHRVLARLPV